MTSSRPHTGSSRTPPTAAIHLPSLANARRRMFAQQGSNSCWVQLFVNRGAHTRRSVSPSARLFNQMCRFRLFILLPHSFASASRRIFAPCEESDSRMVLISKARGAECAATAVHSPPGMSVQPDIPVFVSALPPLSAKAKRMFFRSCRGSNLCM